MNHSISTRRVISLDALVVRYQRAIVLVCGTGLSIGVALALIRFGPMVAAAVIGLALAPLIAPALLQRPIVGASCLVLVISSFPIGRIAFGPLPIYFMDIAIVITLTSLMLLRYPKIDWVGKALLLYLFLWVPTLIAQIGRLGIVVESVYGFGRHALPIVAFFIGWALFQQLRSHAFRTSLYIGVTITSVLAVMQFIPSTRGIMRDIHFAVIPDAAPSLYRVYPDRGSAFFFSPTALSGFLALILPFLALDLLRPKERQHPLSRAVLAIVIVGLIATVSRQWVPASLVGFWALGRLLPRSRGSLVKATAAFAAVAVVVVALGVVDTGYVGDRFGRLANPTQDQNVVARWQRQANFFRYASGHPQILVVGNGYATQDIIGRGLISEQRAREISAGQSENSWLLEMYNNGMLAAALYIGVIVAVVRRGWRAARLVGDGDPHVAGLTAIVVTGIVLHFTDRFMSETELVRAYFFLMIGWVAKESAMVLECVDTPVPVREAANLGIGEVP